MISWKWLKTESENPLFSYVANFLLNEPGEVRKQIKTLNDLTVNLIFLYTFPFIQCTIVPLIRYKQVSWNYENLGGSQAEQRFGDYSDGEIQIQICKYKDANTKTL